MGGGPCAVRHVTARASVYFDVLNQLVMDARLEPARTAERAMGALHLGAVRPGDVALTDRGYCGVEWLGRVRAAGADFVCRVPRRWRREADALFRANQPGVCRTLELALKGPLRRRLHQAGFSQERLRVRLVTLRLSTGELEVLATSLMDEAAYPTEAFGQLYYSSVFLSNVESVLSGPTQAELTAGAAGPGASVGARPGPARDHDQ
jgi:hypothetical protein